MCSLFSRTCQQRLCHVHPHPDLRKFWGWRELLQWHQQRKMCCNHNRFLVYCQQGFVHWPTGKAQSNPVLLDHVVRKWGCPSCKTSHAQHQRIHRNHCKCSQDLAAICHTKCGELLKTWKGTILCCWGAKAVPCAKHPMHMPFSSNFPSNNPSTVTLLKPSPDPSAASERSWQLRPGC